MTLMPVSKISRVGVEVLDLGGVAVDGPALDVVVDRLALVDRARRAG